MSNDASNVFVGWDGAVWYSPDAEPPTSATEELNSEDWIPAGYLKADGVTESITKTTQALRAWQRNTKVRTLLTAEDVTYSFVVMETNEFALLMRYGNYNESGIKVGGEQSTRGVFVIDMLDGDQRIRYVIPDAEVTDLGDLVAVNDDSLGYPTTITPNHDDGIGGYAMRYEAVLVEES